MASCEKDIFVDRMLLESAIEIQAAITIADWWSWLQHQPNFFCHHQQIPPGDGHLCSSPSKVTSFFTPTATWGYESKPWLDTFSTSQTGNFSQLATINFTHWGFNGLDLTAAHREQPAVAKLLDFAFGKKQTKKNIWDQVRKDPLLAPSLYNTPVPPAHSGDCCQVIWSAWVHAGQFVMSRLFLFFLNLKKKKKITLRE